MLYAPPTGLRWCGKPSPGGTFIFFHASAALPGSAELSLLSCNRSQLPPWLLFPLFSSWGLPSGTASALGSGCGFNCGVRVCGRFQRDDVKGKMHPPESSSGADLGGTEGKGSFTDWLISRDDGSLSEWLKVPEDTGRQVMGSSGERPGCCRAPPG